MKLIYAGLAGAAVLAAAAGGVYLYGSAQYRAGYAAAQQHADGLRQRLEQGMQYEKEQADVRWRRAIWLSPVAVLMGCSAPMAVIPRVPPPAPELMEPTPTGSEVLQRATRSMETWHGTLLSGQTE